MKRACLLWILLAGCALTLERPKEAEPGGISDAEEAGAAAPESRVASVEATRVVPFRGELECASGTSLRGDELVPSIWRVDITAFDSGMRATLERGPLFQSHGGSWNEAVPDLRDEILRSTGPWSFAGALAADLVIELEPGTPFAHGELRVDGSSSELLCWDRIAIFGSAWSSQPLDLPRYDTQLGGCVGPDGEPAAPQALPLPFVLETGHGECVDFRDVRLNADDFGSPDIAVQLRGADLTGAQLHFATLSGSLEGARLGELVYGYAEVSGAIDTATQLPTTGNCERIVSSWGGDRATCRH